MLGTLERAKGTLHLCALGSRLGAKVPSGDALERRLDTLFDQDARTRNTCAALHKVFTNVSKHSAILYLADWHFEDDYFLEDLVERLRRRSLTFSVIGSEACFGRAWNDGFYPPDRGRDERGNAKLYDEGIGRAPFDPGSRDAPWHGGDTAYPHVPFFFHGAWWSTQFPATVKTLVPKSTNDYGEKDRRKKKRNAAHEDLRERMGDADQYEEREETYAFPLPSTFGPYGLMRLAGVTGGTIRPVVLEPGRSLQPRL